MFVNIVMKCSAPSLEPHSSSPSIDVSGTVLSTGSVGDFIPVHAVACRDGRLLPALETLPVNFCKRSGCLISGCVHQRSSILFVFSFRL